MDGFSDYNQIHMAPEDMEKTTFITEWGTFCYRVMPFGLQNAGATYQRMPTTLLYDMMHRKVEVYVDDMIVKSKDKEVLRLCSNFSSASVSPNLSNCKSKKVLGVTSGKPSKALL